MVPASTRRDTANSSYAPELRIFVFALFFIFGGITSLNDVIIPKLKGLFTLTYAEAMLVQSAFFGAYFIVSLPAAALLRRIGYMRTATVGLLLMTLGCLLLVPASRGGLFPLFLGALFVLAAGITTVQVVSNPLISMPATPQTAHSRLTLAQAFNSLGTTIFPYVGAMLILNGTLASQDATTLAGAALSALTDVDPSSPVATEETFGPVAPLMRAGSEQHAVQLANESRYGLGAVIWTRDIARARETAARLQSGSVSINAVTASDPRLPVGGVKLSGYGREPGEHGMRELVNVQSVVAGPVA
jgi:MFS family permease